MMKFFDFKLNSNTIRIFAVSLVGVTQINAQACSDSSYIGSICTVAFDYCPDGTLPADGRQLAVNQYNAVYALLGYRFGGSGSYFNIPDLRSRVPVGYSTSLVPGLTAVGLGQKDGAQSVMILPNNLPAHTHPAVANGEITAPANLPLVSGTVSGQTINGAVTVNALNGDSTPSGGVNIPNNSANTVGKTGSSPNFYPQGTVKVAVPTSHNLSVTGGTVAGFAKGDIKVPLSGAAISVEPNVTTNSSLPITPPRLGVNYCVVINGMWPPRP